jgi:hypothetical protein
MTIQPLPFFGLLAHANGSWGMYLHTKIRRRTSDELGKTINKELGAPFSRANPVGTDDLLGAPPFLGLRHLLQ